MALPGNRKNLLVDPFDDENVQAGQGTVAVEILEQADQQGIAFDQILIPVGGGGLIAGVSTYLKDQAPEIKLIGVEASGARSMKAALTKDDRSNWNISINLRMG